MSRTIDRELALVRRAVRAAQTHAWAVLTQYATGKHRKALMRQLLAELRSVERAVPVTHTQLKPWARALVRAMRRAA